MTHPNAGLTAHCTRCGEVVDLDEAGCCPSCGQPATPLGDLADEAVFLAELREEP